MLGTEPNSLNSPYHTWLIVSIHWWYITMHWMQLKQFSLGSFKVDIRTCGVNIITVMSNGKWFAWNIRRSITIQVGKNSNYIHLYKDTYVSIWAAIAGYISFKFPMNRSVNLPRDGNFLPVSNDMRSPFPVSGRNCFYDPFNAMAPSTYYRSCMHFH